MYILVGQTDNFLTSCEQSVVTAVPEAGGAQEQEWGGLLTGGPQSQILKMRRSPVWEEGGVRVEGSRQRDRMWEGCGVGMWAKGLDLF